MLEALTQWSLMRASNSEIFEIHDTLEKQFFLVSQAFEEANVSMRYANKNIHKTEKKLKYIGLS